MKQPKNNCALLIFLIVSTCFGAKAKMQSFIVGGNLTQIKLFPHSVFLSVECGAEWICGSSLLTQDIILTAAHCLVDCGSNWNIDAFAGDERLNKMKILRQLSKMIIHSDYNEETVENDIALGFADKKFPLGNSIKRVLLKRKIPENPNARVAGWGMINEATGEQSITLKAAYQTLKPLKYCSGFGKLAKGMLCVEGSSARPSKGDSGSAIMTGDYQQIGVVSFRVAKYPKLTIYTDVSYYYDWISAKSRMLYCDKKKMIL